MKSINRISKLLAATLMLFAVFSLSSCSKSMTFSNSNVVPAATGSVKVKSDKNNNHSISLDINNLAPASHLTPPKKTYVVWMITQDHETKNIGQLKSTTGFLSNTLKGSLNAVTPLKPSSFFITAEDDGSVEYPGMTVLSTR